MDPVTLAVLTSAVTMLASEVGKGIAGEVGKNAWSKIKSLFKWSAEPAEADLSAEIAKALQATEALGRQVVELLKAQSTGTASKLVGSISVNQGSVTVVGTNTGTINNTNTFN